MINEVNLKGIITYKTPLKHSKKTNLPYMEFGLAYNSTSSLRRVYKLDCRALEGIAEFISAKLNVRDIILVNGFLITNENDCKEIPMIMVKTFEPIKTSKHITFTDRAINESLFAEHIRGFDEEELRRD